MLDVLDRIITEAERQGDPEVRILIARGRDEAKVDLSYYNQDELNARHINLAEELGLSGGETVGLFRWAESEGYIRPNYGSGGRDADTTFAVLDHLESEGYEMIGELPDPQERIALVLDAAIRARRSDQSLQIGRGLGAYFFLMLQDISQLQDRIGGAKTRSILGNAGVQFWGKSQDPETARYVSELSGNVQVRRAIYEHDGSERALKQMFSDKDAPYGMREDTRAGLLPEHVHALPKGWWYAYEGNPHAVELMIPAPIHEWEDRMLPEPAPCTILGIPQRRSPRALPPAAAEEPGEDREGDEGPNGRACPGCEQPVSAVARFCESCGSRL